jgi:uncharacterized LabA/DUF88 family protein
VTTDLVLIDGPNLFGSIARYMERHALPSDWCSEPDASNRYYVASWLGLDRIARRTAPDVNKATLGTVIVHSSRALGGGKLRLKQAETRDFWARQGAAVGTSCLQVDIPNDQQETYPFECKGCAAENEATTTSEKGIDVSMVVYLFESMDRWNSVVLFTRDVDFVPAVWALRRRGKSVFVAGEPSDARTALGRASQSFYQLNFEWLEQDRLACEILRPGGALDRCVERCVPQWNVSVLVDGGVWLRVERDPAKHTRVEATMHETFPASCGFQLTVEPDGIRAKVRVHVPGEFTSPAGDSAAGWTKYRRSKAEWDKG